MGKAVWFEYPLWHHLNNQREPGLRPGFRFTFLADLPHSDRSETFSCFSDQFEELAKTRETINARRERAGGSPRWE